MKIQILSWKKNHLIWDLLSHVEDEDDKSSCTSISYSKADVKVLNSFFVTYTVDKNIMDVSKSSCSKKTA